MFDFFFPSKLASSLTVAQAYVALLKIWAAVTHFPFVDYSVFVCWGLEKSLFPEVDTKNYTGETANKLLCKCQSLIRKWSS